MSREWKPGDVAIVTWADDKAIYSAVAVRMRVGDGWQHGLDWGGGSVYDNISRPEVRPLVAIDPEDDEQVERFTRLLPEDWCLLNDEDATGSLRSVADALREFAKLRPARTPVVDAGQVTNMLEQVAADRESPYWADGHTDILDATETYLRSLADHLGVTS